MVDVSILHSSIVGALLKLLNWTHSHWGLSLLQTLHSQSITAVHSLPYGFSVVHTGLVLMPADAPCASSARLAYLQHAVVACGYTCYDVHG